MLNASTLLSGQLKIQNNKKKPHVPFNRGPHFFEPWLGKPISDILKSRTD